jgi:hypothetical protein
MMIVADRKVSLVLTGNGDVLEPEHGVTGIGSGGNYALAAARAMIDLDMTAEEIARSAGAVNGQVLTLTVKAGLPLGSVRQRVSITSHDEQSKPAELSITGKAVGDISVVGKEFNGDGDYVDLGNIPASAGKKSRLSLLVKGAHRSQVKFTIKGVDPQSSLRVTLGEPLPQGKSVSWPLVLEIPPDTEPVNRLGSELGRLGRIELETGTSEVPPCVVRVRFAVTAE